MGAFCTHGKSVDGGWVVQPPATRRREMAVAEPTFFLHPKISIWGFRVRILIKR